MNLPRAWGVSPAWFTIGFVALLSLAVPAPCGAAWAQGGNLASSGSAKFREKKYDEAIELYRRHLRRAPKDYGTWNKLGAAYFHTGQPRKALRYLKHVERRTLEKSYNYYYQGLCLLAVDSTDLAKDYFAFAAQRFSDEYASRSTFEMAALEYNVRNKPRAQYWLNLYLQRYPSGVYRAQAQRMLSTLASDAWLERVEGTEKPDIEKALFKYNKWSLSPQPHYWFIEGGTQYATSSGQEPAPGGGLKPRSSVNLAALANAGIGLGPWRSGDMTLFGGYNYRQKWITDQDRLDTWMDDPGDIEYFPLRGDLLERRHQLYGDFRRDFGNGFFFGAFLRYEIARIGSSWFPGPDDKELKKVLKISDTSLFIPWLGASWGNNMRTLAYFYMRKELNEDSPEHSNKTYDFSGDQPALSLGISHDMDFPEYKLNVGLEVFRYEFIYNDYWLDYKREGLFVSAEHELLPRWYLQGLLGYYQDDYVLNRLKQNSCSSQPKLSASDSAIATDTSAGTQAPSQCPRTDTGTLYQVGVYWNWTQFQRFTFNILMVENKNPDQQEFDESKMQVELTYTTAFPSVKRVTRFVNRFADTAFTKEAE